MKINKTLYNLVISLIVMQEINDEDKIEEAIENVSKLLSLSEIVTEEDKKIVKFKVRINMKNGLLVKNQN